jgi:protein NrfD
MNAQPQAEWGTRVALDFFLGGAGAGLLGVYLISRWLSGIEELSVKIVLCGALLVVAGLCLLLSELGRPANALRSMKNLKTSWMARGAVFNIGLVGSALLLLAADGAGLKVFTPFLAFATACFAVLVAAYPGLLLFSSKDVWVWRSPLLPALLFCSAGMSGVAVLALADIDYCFQVGMTLYDLSLLGMILLALLFAFFWGTRFLARDSGAKRQFRRIMTGKLQTFFLLGAVGAGLILPLACIGLAWLMVEFAELLRVVAASSYLVGAFALRYCVLKAAWHEPITILGRSQPQKSGSLSGSLTS